MSVAEHAATERTGRGEQTRGRYPEQHGYVDRDGVRVFYEVYGEGEPTILFLPTWTFVHSRIWKMQIPYFARHHRDVDYAKVETDGARNAAQRIADLLN